MDKKVVVVGAGAAGLVAAGHAGELGKKVILVEKNNIIGKKLLITGKGRCNITNNCDIEDLIKNTPGNGNFLYSSFYTFSNFDIMDLFSRYGLETKVERGERVFPQSDRAKDVVEALKRYIESNNVEVLYNSTLSEIDISDNKVKGIKLQGGKYIEADSVILATGGASYKGTGSTGDGYKIAEKLGHSIIDLKPSLVPLESNNDFIKDLQGLSLKNISIKLINKAGKEVYSDFGEMIFTHFGVSGPVILSGSRHILEYNYRDITLSIDLKPALSHEKLDLRVQRDFEKNSRKQFKNALDELLPKKLIPVIIKLSNISEDKFVNQITKEERKIIVELLKNFKINITGSRPINEAIITAGGIRTGEINPSTMESKIVKGLYFAGEIIDVDAYTGGFNLTIAFSTGFLAGTNC